MDNVVRTTQVPAAFLTLAAAVGRTFYAGLCPPPGLENGVDGGSNASASTAAAAASAAAAAQLTPPAERTGGRKNKPQPLGLGAVLLDALAAREWVNEDDLADALGVHAKAVRRALRFLEREQLVQREHRKESARGIKRAGGDASESGEADKGGVEKGGAAGDASVVADSKPQKQHVHSYCSIDWPRLHDVVRWRLAACRASLKERAAGADAVANYRCPRCGARHDTLHAARLIDPRDGEFHCDGEDCGGEVLVPATAAAAPKKKEEGEEDGDDGEFAAPVDDGVVAKQLLERFDAEVAPLDAAVAAVDAALAAGAMAPDFGPLTDWVAAATAAAAGRGGGGGGGGGRGGAAPQVVAIELAGTASGADAGGAGPGEPKELPPWLRASGLGGGIGGDGAPSASAGAGAAPEEAQREYAARFEAEVARRAAEIAAQGGGGGDEGREAKRLRFALGGGEGEKEEGGDEEWEVAGAAVAKAEAEDPAATEADAPAATEADEDEWEDA